MTCRPPASAARGFVAAALMLLQAACGPTADTSDQLAAKIEMAEALSPTDPRLAEMYVRSCRACHVNPASGAPLTGDASAWRERLAQGTDTLVMHARDGFKAMPPQGQCFDCSDVDLKRLTLFMAGRERRAAQAP